MNEYKAMLSMYPVLPPPRKGDVNFIQCLHGFINEHVYVRHKEHKEQSMSLVTEINQPLLIRRQ